MGRDDTVEAVGQRNRLQLSAWPLRLSNRDRQICPSSPWQPAFVPELKERLFGCSDKVCNVIELGAPSYPLLLPHNRFSSDSVLAWRCWNWNGVVGPRSFALGLFGGYPRRISHTIHRSS